jgi:hypothetical protein
MSFMSVFVALLLICTIDGGVHAVFTPADRSALNKAVTSCLSETGDGSCPTFAASNDATGNPYGVIGDWDVSQVTSLQTSLSTPPSCFCCWFFHWNSVHSLLVAFFFLTFSRF